MLVFIDESGDPGLGVGSRYLVFAMVIFQNNAAANQTDKAIEALRKSGIHKREFKFSKTRNEVRDGFFNAIMSQPFSVKAVVWDTYAPLSLGPQGKKIPPAIVYQLALNKLFNMATFTNAHICIDGQISKRFARIHQDHLNASNSNAVIEITARDSKTNNLIQLADMVVGAVARSLYPQNKHRNRWRRKLKLNKSDIFMV